MKKKLLWVLVLLTVLLGAVSTCSAKGKIKTLDTWPKRFYSKFCETAGTCFRDMRSYPNEVYLYSKYCYEIKTLDGLTITLYASGDYTLMVSATLKVPVSISDSQLRTALIAFIRASADCIFYPNSVYSDLESFVDEYLNKAIYYRIKDKCTVYKHTCISCTKTKDERFYLYTAH